MKTSTCRDGTLKNKMGTTPQHFHTIPTSCASLLCVSSVHWRVIEGSGLGSAGCVGHIDVHALRVSCVVDCYNAIASEHGRYGLSCTQKLWSAQAVLSLYGMLECKLCHEIVLLLNMADILLQEGW